MMYIHVSTLKKEPAILKDGVRSDKIIHVVTASGQAVIMKEAQYNALEESGYHASVPN